MDRRPVSQLPGSLTIYCHFEPEAIREALACYRSLLLERQEHPDPLNFNEYLAFI